MVDTDMEFNTNIKKKIIRVRKKQNNVSNSFIIGNLPFFAD